MDYIPKRFKNCLIQEKISVMNWFEWEKLFKTLLQYPVNTEEELKKFILDWSEVYCEYQSKYKDVEVQSKLDFKNVEKTAELRNCEKIYPKFQEMNQSLKEHYSKSSFREEFLTNNSDYKNFDERVLFDCLLPADFKNDHKSKLDELSKKVHAIKKRFPRHNFAKNLSGHDRFLRKSSWSMLSDGSKMQVQEIDMQYKAMIEQRDQIAKKAGFKNFTEYKLKRIGFDDIKINEFIDNVKEGTVKAQEHFSKIRAEKLKIDMVKPWDMDAVIFGPFFELYDSNKIFATFEEGLKKNDSELYEVYESFKKYDLIDIENKWSKVRGVSCTTFPDSSFSFLMVNFDKKDTVFNALTHALGHGIHAYYQKDIPVYFLHHAGRNAFKEFVAEAIQYIILDGVGKKDLIHSQFENGINQLSQSASSFSFQKWSYENLEASTEDRNKKWSELYDQFHKGITWEKSEHLKEFQWQNDVSIFNNPFHKGNMIFSKIAGLKFYQNFLKDKDKALTDLKKAMKIGNTMPLEELFKMAGVELYYSKEEIESITVNLIDA